MKRALFMLVTLPAVFCLNVDNIFENINNNVLKFNAQASKIAWESSINPGNPELPIQAAEYHRQRITWEQETCDMIATLHESHFMNSTQARQTYLLCRGPKYNFQQARLVSDIYDELQTIYTEAKVCIPSTNISIDNTKEVESAILSFLTDQSTKHEIDTFSAKANERVERFCLRGEDDFEKVMGFSNNEKVLKWIWATWREKVGPPMKDIYRRLVSVENTGARRNGYKDIGAAWRGELEIPQLRQICRKLYEEVKPLYTLLHGVVRFYLRRFYGEVVPERGPIPAHLLGNLWSQNWEPISDLILSRNIDLDQSIKKLNWTVLHMAKRAEDFYQSLGLPFMTDTFWRRSLFARENTRTRCHGAAADMFKNGDFRLIYCSDTSKEDFYVLHHEMGHIQFYMAYETQPALFRQANAAFHESIGDAIMYGVLTPQHLHRLRIINDSLLYIDQKLNENKEERDLNTYEAVNDGLRNNDDNLLKISDVDENQNVFDEVTFHKVFNEIKNHDKVRSKDKNNFEDESDAIFKATDDILVLKQALNKIPQIPFALLIDEYRWKYFEGGIPSGELNSMFWKMALELQGIAPSSDRGEEYFDIGAKFHVPDNTPYIRYFLSSFLQHQLFEALCKASVFGRRADRLPLPEGVTLDRCDIYGSKAAGKILKDIMSRGHSQHWRDILQQTTGQDNISASSLKRYYRPLHRKLTKLVRKYNIPIGWTEPTWRGLYFG